MSQCIKIPHPPQNNVKIHETGSRMIQKRWHIYWVIEAAALILYILLYLAAGVLILGGAVFFLLSVIWYVYYYRLEYSIQQRELLISAGIIFRKHRRLPLDNILWTMRLTLPRRKPHASRVILTSLHTSGGRAIVFGEILAEN